jgi:hypothetical protein
MKTKTKPRLKAKKRFEVPRRFKLHAFDEADGRRFFVRRFRERLQELIDEAGADSIQKRSLCEEAVFIKLMLETMRKQIACGEKVDGSVGSYGQLVNTYQGILKKLGLDKHSHAELDLQTYGGDRRNGKKKAK